MKTPFKLLVWLLALGLFLGACGGEEEPARPAYKTFTSDERCPANPWGEGATTLEWTVPSPPPFHTFNELPQVK